MSLCLRSPAKLSFEEELWHIPDWAVPQMAAKNKSELKIVPAYIYMAHFIWNPLIA